MNGLISLLLREGAAALTSSEMIKRPLRRIVTELVIYTLVATFALAALAFFYVLIYLALAADLGGQAAAAILCGGNLLAVGLVLIARSLSRPRRPKPYHPLASHPALANPNFDAGIHLGRRLGEKLRKAAPEFALAAGLIGLVVGVRPQILGLFRRRAPKARDPQR